MKIDNVRFAPEISVIIPCYRTDLRTLEKCINSVITQTYTNFEILIIDDGSGKEYCRIYQSILQKDKRIRIFFKENGGVSSARNYGLKNAKGKYITFVDSDDCLVPCFFEEAYQIADKEECDMIIGCNIHLSKYKSYLNEHPKNEDCVFWTNNEVNKLKPYMVGKRLAFQNNLIYIGRGPWTRIVKREIAIGTFFDCTLSICEDIIWNLEVLEKSKKVCYVKRPWYLYNMQNDSATRGYNEKIVQYSQNGLEAIHKHLDFNIDAEFRAFCERCLEDILTINRRYLSNMRCNLSGREKHLIRKKMYAEYPWNILKNRRFFRLASRKDKTKWILYKMRIIFFVDSIY